MLSVGIQRTLRGILATCAFTQQNLLTLVWTKHHDLLVPSAGTQHNPLANGEDLLASMCPDLFGSYPIKAPSLEHLSDPNTYASLLHNPWAPWHLQGPASPAAAAAAPGMRDPSAFTWWSDRSGSSTPSGKRVAAVGLHQATSLAPATPASLPLPSQGSSLSAAPGGTRTQLDPSELMVHHGMQPASLLAPAQSALPALHALHAPRGLPLHTGSSSLADVTPIRPSAPRRAASLPPACHRLKQAVPAPPGALQPGPGLHSDASAPASQLHCPPLPGHAGSQTLLHKLHQNFRPLLNTSAEVAGSRVVPVAVYFPSQGMQGSQHGEAASDEEGMWEREGSKKQDEDEPYFGLVAPESRSDAERDPDYSPRSPAKQQAPLPLAAGGPDSQPGSVSSTCRQQVKQCQSRPGARGLVRRRRVTAAAEQHPGLLATSEPLEGLGEQTAAAAGSGFGSGFGQAEAAAGMEYSACPLSPAKQADQAHVEPMTEHLTEQPVCSPLPASWAAAEALGGLHPHDPAHPTAHLTLQQLSSAAGRVWDSMSVPALPNHCLSSPLQGLETYAGVATRNPGRDETVRDMEKQMHAAAASANVSAGTPAWVRPAAQMLSPVGSRVRPVSQQHSPPSTPNPSAAPTIADGSAALLQTQLRESEAGQGSRQGLLELPCAAASSLPGSASLAPDQRPAAERGSSLSAQGMPAGVAYAGGSVTLPLHDFLQLLACSQGAVPEAAAAAVVKGQQTLRSMGGNAGHAQAAQQASAAGLNFPATAREPFLAGAQRGQPAEKVGGCSF